ncbi:glutamate synthase [NADH] [Basidiobolus ranarum]|uniref:Glutamate synthase [NADH] n=1 Tax=Basidiobolus ranarum TaxID=34480 RepID=A0ABR2WIG1_9FUNG
MSASFGTTATNNTSWAGAIPEAKGLYNPDFEKDGCGVGFMVQINGIASHNSLKDGKTVLCIMRQ